MSHLLMNQGENHLHLYEDMSLEESFCRGLSLLNSSELLSVVGEDDDVFSTMCCVPDLLQMAIDDSSTPKCPKSQGKELTKGNITGESTPSKDEEALMESNYAVICFPDNSSITNPKFTGREHGEDKEIDTQRSDIIGDSLRTEESQQTEESQTPVSSAFNMEASQIRQSEERIPLDDAIKLLLGDNASFQNQSKSEDHSMQQTKLNIHSAPQKKRNRSPDPQKVTKKRKISESIPVQSDSLTDLSEFNAQMQGTSHASSENGNKAKRQRFIFPSSHPEVGALALQHPHAIPYVIQNLAMTPFVHHNQAVIIPQRGVGYNRPVTGSLGPGNVIQPDYRVPLHSDNLVLCGTPFPANQIMNLSQ